MLQSQLAACEDDRQRIRHPFEVDGPPNESPAAWTEAVEEAIDACDLPVELDVIECSEYPCVAGLRPVGGVALAEGFQTLSAQLGSAVHDCAPLRSAFSVGDEQLAALQVHEVKVPCADRTTSEATYALVALDTHGAAWESWQTRDDGDNFEDVLRRMFRRADDLAAMSRCTE